MHDAPRDDPATTPFVTLPVVTPPQLPQPGLPQPPLPPPHHVPRALPGEITPGWRTAMIIVWAGVVVGLLAVWRSAWSMGLPTWWLGPQSSARAWPVILIPFVAPVIVIACAAARAPYLWAYGLAASIVTSYVAFGDVGRVNGYALVEFALAAGGGLVSIASFAGTTRRAR